MRCAVVLVILAACGRVGFDDTAAGDAGGDSGDANEQVCTPACVSVTTLDSCAGVVQCANGCEDGPPAGCVSVMFTPSNGVDPAVADIPGLEPTFLSPGETATIDTDTGYIELDGTQYRGAGPGLINGIYYEQTGTHGVFAIKSGTFRATSAIRAFGTRTLILVVKQDLALEGTLDVSAGMCPATGNNDPRCGGPNGGRGATATVAATGCGPGGDGNGLFHPGGGGGAFGTAGGAGGNAGGSVGAAGAATSCSTDVTTALTGGSGGGESDQGGDGGGGGGAVQLTVFGAFIGTDAIVASGAGGRSSGGNVGGGGGGGSGGAILIEAGAIMFTGVLAANGGAGGEGDGFNAGQDGQASASAATCGVGLGNRGGAGGALASGPSAGTGASEDAGGGGGAVGRIHLRSTSIETTGAIVSPAATTSTL